MELHSIKAFEKDISLELYVESCFPKDVTGERAKLEILLDYVLSYFLDHTFKDSIKVWAKLRQPIDEGFILSFEFECSQNSEMTEESIEATFTPEKCHSPRHMHNNRVNQSLERKHFIELINWLKGGIETGARENQIYLQIELIFGTHDQSKPTYTFPKIDVIPKIKTSQYVTKWMKEVKRPSAASHMRKSADLSGIQQALRKHSDNPAVNEEKTKELVKEKLRSIRETQSPQLCSRKRGTFVNPLGELESKQVAYHRKRNSVMSPLNLTELMKASHTEENVNSPFTDPNKRSIITLTPIEGKREDMKMDTGRSEGSHIACDVDEHEKSPADNNQVNKAVKLHLGECEILKGASKEKTFMRIPTYPNCVFGDLYKACTEKVHRKAETRLHSPKPKLTPDTGGCQPDLTPKLDLKSPTNSAKDTPPQPKVLLVEDTAFNLLPIKTVLGKKKISYEVAENGEIALNKYKNSKYTSIFMDLEMPIMDGFESTQKIREYERDNKLSPTFICGLSASDDPETISRCKESGMDDFLAKPVKMSKMIEFILDPKHLI